MVPKTVGSSLVDIGVLVCWATAPDVKNNKLSNRTWDFMKPRFSNFDLDIFYFEEGSCNLFPLETFGKCL